MPPSPRLKPYAVLAVTLLAALLDIGTSVVGTAIIVTLGAAVAITWPPQHAPPKPIGSLLLITTALPLLSFLPSSLTSNQHWRPTLTGELEIPLLLTTTPQPWVTFDAWLVFSAALLWAYYLASQHWNDNDRSLLVRGLALGIAALATLLLAPIIFGSAPPASRPSTTLALPFHGEHRVSLLAVAAALVATASRLAFDLRDTRWLYWIPASVPLLAAAIASGALAGVVLVLVALLLWLLATLNTRTPSKALAIGSAALLICVSAVLSFGGDLIERFSGSAALSASLDNGDRNLVYQDLKAMVVSSPVVGHGLGNLDSVFPFYRDATHHLPAKRPLDPGNDFLQLAAEGGIPLLLSSVFTLAAFAYRTRPLRQTSVRRTARPVRLGAAVACVVVVIHGFISAPAHTPGVFPTIALLASLALARSHRRPLGKLSLPLRSVPYLFVVLGGYWLIAQSASSQLPGASRWASNPRRPQPTGLSLAALNEAIASRPLDAQLYFRRASLQLAGGHHKLAALDFARARHLAPQSLPLAAQEAGLWQSVDPLLAADAWRFIIENHEEESLRAYDEMLAAAADLPDLMAAAKQLASLRSDLLIAYLRHLPAREFQPYLDELLAGSPDLSSVSSKQLPDLLDLWYAKGDRPRLLKALSQFDRWWQAGWLLYAGDLASKGQYQKAVEIAMANSRKPPTPNLSDHREYTELRRDFLIDPSDAQTGLYLYQTQRRAGAFGQALETISKVSQLDEPPDYVPYLKAELHVLSKQWQEAWASIQQHNRLYPPY